ncbi:RluA family pseudouridine synthase [Candidatus Margulisiibacteriota bacterium]
MRLDQYISQQYGISRAYTQKLIKQGTVTVNGLTAKASYQLQADDKALADIPTPEKIEALPEDIPLDIVYEDEDLLAINKQAGMVVHPACGHHSGTLVNALLAHCDDLSGIGGMERPGIVHRLDKDTCGLILVAKNDRAHQALSKQFKGRTITKKYRTLVQGNVLNDNGTIDQPLGRNPQNRKKMVVTANPHFKSRNAVTHYSILHRFHSATLLDIGLETGRTHQIRVHLAFIGHPIIGDPIYGKQKSSGLRLQAYFLEFQHPVSGKTITLTIPPLKWGEY